MPEIPPVPALWHFPALPTSVARARQAVTHALPKGLSPCLTDDLTLLTSELVTNAVRHRTDPTQDDRVELILWPADGHYWLAVSDPGIALRAKPIPTVTHQPDPGSESGRGLFLVDRLAAAWTVRPRTVCGTSVIAGLPLGERRNVQ